jgi:hypothetical protein
MSSTAYVTRTYSRLAEVATRHSQVSTHPGYTIVTHHTMDVSPYRMIGTASSEPCLEATCPGFTSPVRRILTFLPYRRCVVTKSKLQKVNTCYLATYQDYYSPYTGIEVYPHHKFFKNMAVTIVLYSYGSNTSRNIRPLSKGGQS